MNASQGSPLDLYFAIGPNGMPKYGKTVTWNLKNQTNGAAHFYHLKKGDFGLTAIQHRQQNINYTGSTPFSPQINTNVQMPPAKWIKVESSWNFAPDSYTIAVIAFSNNGNKQISNGALKVSYPLSANLNFVDCKIYNNWVNTNYLVQNVSGAREYQFQYNDLKPGEIRYLYLTLSLKETEDREKMIISQFDLKAEMVGYGSDVLNATTNPVPHDPNAMYLMNTYYQGAFNNCSALQDFPHSYQECLDGGISWLGMSSTKCKTIIGDDGVIIDPEIPNDEGVTEYCHIMDYPYCHVNKENLFYRVSCFNDGEGIAKDILFKPNFHSPSVEPFISNDYKIIRTTNYLQSQVASGFGYPNFKFLFGDVNLPGMADPDYVRMYSECSASIEFKTQTKCKETQNIEANAGIIFYDLAGNEQPIIETNHVRAIPQEPYNDFTYCTKCKNTSTPLPNNQSKSAQNNNTENELDQRIQIFNLSGLFLHEGRLNINNKELLLKELFNKLQLESGMFLIRSKDKGTIKYLHIRQ